MGTVEEHGIKLKSLTPVTAAFVELKIIIRKNGRLTYLYFRTVQAGNRSLSPLTTALVIKCHFVEKDVIFMPFFIDINLNSSNFIKLCENQSTLLRRSCRKFNFR